MNSAFRAAAGRAVTAFLVHALVIGVAACIQLQLLHWGVYSWLAEHSFAVIDLPIAGIIERMAPRLIFVSMAWLRQSQVAALTNLAIIHVVIGGAFYGIVVGAVSFARGSSKDRENSAC